jgi:hypothetical protein
MTTHENDPTLTVAGPPPERRHSHPTETSDPSVAHDSTSDTHSGTTKRAPSKLTAFEKKLWNSRHYPWFQQHAKKKKWNQDDNKLWRTASNRLVILPDEAGSMPRLGLLRPLQLPPNVAPGRTTLLLARNFQRHRTVLPLLHSVRRGEIVQQSQTGSELATPGTGREVVRHHMRHDHGLSHNKAGQ